MCQTDIERVISAISLKSLFYLRINCSKAFIHRMRKALSEHNLSATTAWSMAMHKLLLLETNDTIPSANTPLSSVQLKILNVSLYMQYSGNMSWRCPWNFISEWITRKSRRNVSSLLLIEFGWRSDSRHLSSKL